MVLRHLVLKQYINSFPSSRIYVIHAVELANIPVIVGQKIDDTDKQGFIIRNIYNRYYSVRTDLQKISVLKIFFLNNFELNTGAVDKLYHPS